MILYRIENGSYWLQGSNGEGGLELEEWMVGIIECSVELARRAEDRCACGACVFLRSIAKARKLPRLETEDEEK